MDQRLKYSLIIMAGIALVAFALHKLPVIALWVLNKIQEIRNYLKAKSATRKAINACDRAANDLLLEIINADDQNIYDCNGKIKEFKKTFFDTVPMEAYKSNVDKLQLMYDLRVEGEEFNEIVFS